MNFKEALELAKQNHACERALQVLSQISSWEEFFKLEKAASYSCWFAEYALHGRFELGEVAIATDAGYSYWYANHILQGQFELGETVIATSDCYSYCYAKYILHGRFELGEAVIKGSSWEEDYQEFINSLEK